MATTWIKPTYAHKRYNSKTTIKRKINYIIDREKTTLAVDDGDINSTNIFGDDNIDDYSDAGNFENISKYQNAGQHDYVSTVAVTAVSEYIQNPAKTENNELVTGYECFPEYADEQFAISMEMYEQNTGRKHKDNSRLLYHMRQSFKPGEVDPRVANKIGYELALEFTHGKHAFVVATHTDKAHIHNHIIFNAFNLNCDGKFKDPWYSGRRDVARISDKLCKEYDLSVIEVKQGWRDPYNEWEKKQEITIADKEPAKRKRLEDIIAMCLEKQPKDFKHLLKYLEDYSCFSKRRGSNISITAPFSKNPIRLSSLSEQFTEAGIKKQIDEQRAKISSVSTFESTENSGDISLKPRPRAAATFEPKIVEPKSKTLKTKSKKEKTSETGLLKIGKSELKLIIDIQNSLKATESVGYKKWAEKFNLEQMSQTLLFIEKHQLSLDELQSIATQKPQTLANIMNEITSADEKLQQISLLQRHIGTYGKTKEIYKQYRQSENQEQFKTRNAKSISDHEAAKVYFGEQGYGFTGGKRLPTIKELREQYAKLNTDKKALWAKYHETKNTGKDIDNAWLNVKTLLNIADSDSAMHDYDSVVQQNDDSMMKLNEKDVKRIAAGNTPNL